MTLTQTRSRLLAGAALGFGLTVLTPQEAQAACAIVAGDLVCSGATTTTDTTNGANPPSDRSYPYGSSGTFTDSVAAGATVDGFGLAIPTSGAGTGSYTFTNDGSIQVDAGNTPTAGGSDAALFISGDDNSILYQGSGSIDHLGASGAGLAISQLGSGTITANVGGNVSSASGAGVLLLALDPAGGNILLTSALGTTLSGATGGVNVGNAGTGTVTLNTAGAVNSALAFGIMVNDAATSGSISITTGAVSAFTSGILAQSASLAGNVSVTANGAIVATNGTGVMAALLDPTATGNVSVTTNDTVTGVAGVSAANIGSGSTTVNTVGLVNGPAVGVGATSNGGALSITTGPVTSSSSYAIVAQQINPLGTGAISLTTNGTINGLGGIFALNFGTGATTANINGSVLSTVAPAIEIHALIPGAGAVNLTTAATTALRSDVMGMLVDTVGSGNVTINNSSGILSAGAPGTIQFGIMAGSSGTGNITVNHLAGGIGASLDLIQGIGIIATINNAASAGTISISNASGINSAGLGIQATTNGTGSVSVTGSGSTIAGTGDGIFVQTVNGGVTINTGPVTSTLGVGISAVTTGSGNQSITVGGTTTGSGSGVAAVANTGTIAVNVTGGNVSSTGAGGGAIFVSSSGAMTVTIGAGRTVSAGATGFAALQTGGSGTVTVNNSGTLGGGTYAIFNNTFGNANTINNLTGGILNGRVDLGNLADTLANSGTWNVTGLQNFYAGTDVVTNNAGGVINTATGSTFGGLETYTNTGTTNVTGTLGFTGVATALTSSGTFNLGAGSAVAGLGAVTSSGAFNAAAGSSLSNTGNVTSSGTFTTAGAFGLTTTGIFANSGTLVLAPAAFTLAGATAFNSTGTIRAEGGATTLTSNVALNSTGPVDLQDGATNDVLTLTGSYIAGAGASLLLDFGGTTADRLVVGGNVTGGTTNIVFSAIPGITGVDINGVLVVDVTGTTVAGAFTTTSVLNGLINLAIEQRGVDFFVVAAPNQLAFQPVTLGNLAQDLWHQGAEAFNAMATLRGGEMNSGLQVWLQPYYSSDRYGDATLSFSTLGFNYTIPTRMRTDRHGAQGGIGFNWGGALIGLTAGFQQAAADDYGQDTQGWNLGAYALIGSGEGLYVNLLAKYDSNEVKTGLGVDADADAWGGDAELGWRMPGAGSVGFDVHAGLAYVNADIDPFAVLGITYLLDEVTSLRGRAGARATFRNLAGLFVGAKLLHEFDGETALVLDSTSDASVVNQGRGTWARAEVGIGGPAGFPLAVQAWMDFGDVEGWGLTAGLHF